MKIIYACLAASLLLSIYSCKKAPVRGAPYANEVCGTTRSFVCLTRGHSPYPPYSGYVDSSERSISMTCKDAATLTFQGDDYKYDVASAAGVVR